MIIDELGQTICVADDGGEFHLLGIIVRFIVSALVLLFIGMIAPGFYIAGFWTALIAAIVIAGLGWVFELLFGTQISPYGRGVIGFLTGALVIYLAQAVVPGMRVTVLGAVLASLIIGIIDLFVPTAMRGNEQAHGSRHRAAR